jgi:cell division protein FtsQ
MRRIGVPRPPARFLVVAFLAALLAVPAWLWFRDSSLVRVRDVFITGVAAGDSTRIRTALRSAAQDMTTLNVREDALRAAVAAYPSVAGLRVEADFPHKLTIEVVAHVPVATVVVDGRRTPVAASGLVLRGAPGADALPLVRLQRTASGERVTERRALVALGVLAAAPPVLRSRLERAVFDERGLIVSVERGPQLIFGGSDRARAKWLAAARVLADPRAAGALYLDLRIPERVAAGGVGPTTAGEPTPVPTVTTAPAVPPAPAATAAATPVPTATPAATPVPVGTPIPGPPAGDQTTLPNPQP